MPWDSALPGSLPETFLAYMEAHLCHLTLFAYFTLWWCPFLSYEHHRIQSGIVWV